MSVVVKGYLTCVDALEDVSDVFWLKVGKRDGCLDGFSCILSAIMGTIVSALMLDSRVDQCLNGW
eukprot:CAMPEP_0198112900 /NCGR_PEP_ID=MMETSP1442-20131203/4677_1 /TAXON_ID= /ORGANISM="Craspedostauros australis, Strain CCMP3328" /LENGTH=64 /DNA_ID=CAMNT_0043769829 /DNA_START=337 /DNA_END=528 /DNA_ORIENTATION=+